MRRVRSWFGEPTTRDECACFLLGLGTGVGLTAYVCVAVC